MQINVMGMFKAMLRIAYLILFTMLLAGCQSLPGSKNSTVSMAALQGLLEKGSDVLFTVNSLMMIQRDFDHGRIMQARARALDMDKSHRDYVKSQRFLKEKIEPARRQLFVHYLRAAKHREQQQRWAAAMWAYDQAKAVTIKPEKMARKQAEMALKMRQLRFEKLLKQRRKEDVILLADVSAYESPKGVNPNDEVYERMREHYNDLLDDRADRAFRESKRFLRKDLPEIAYVEIESYMRLQPDMVHGRKRFEEIRKLMPTSLSITPMQQSRAQKGVLSTQRMIAPKNVTDKQILAAMKSGELIKAQQLVQVYRRNDGKDAEMLKAQVQRKVDRKAASLFTLGSSAFGKEKLDQAIAYWHDAVALRPEKPEYQEALRRAKQLKERLSLLREQKADHISEDMMRALE